ncbi:MAG TPA: FmdB family zinc ribbon protein [Acidimicrobiales bacterium]|nr:FmdB family zinc ribbon protein [Acidimicrobiales bacterium]
MPTYEYACTACGHRLEAVQSFSDDPLTTCPECAGGLRKVYGAVGIVLKGSGFYKTDSRTGSGTKGSGGSVSAESGASSESASGAKPDAPSNGKDEKGSSGKDAAPAASASST